MMDELYQEKESAPVYMKDKGAIKIIPISWLAPVSVFCILVLSALIFLGNVYLNQNLIFDDTYITFRFSRNLVEYGEIVWNAGGERVEGYTSLLHVLLIAGAMKANINPETASVGIAVFSTLVTVALLVWVLNRQSGFLFLPSIVVLCIYMVDQISASLVGMALETQLFALLLCLTYILAIRFIDFSDLLSALLLSVCVSLSILGRPEGLLYGAVTYAGLVFYMFLVNRSRPASSGVRNLLISIFMVVVFGSIYAVWKFDYFGYLLPNTFYVKSNQVTAAGVIPVGEYLFHITSYISPFILAAVLLSPFRKIKDFLRIPQNLAKVFITLVPPLLALLYNATIIHVGGGNHRFSYPTYFYYLAATGIFLAVSARERTFIQSDLLRIFLGGWIAFLVIISRADIQELLRFPLQPKPNDDLYRYHLKIGRALESTGLKSQATILNDASGIIPYFSGFNQIDRVGLTDNYLSGREGLTWEQREEYMWNSGADVYIGYEPPASANSSSLQDDPRMGSSYVADILLGNPSHGMIAESRIFTRDPHRLYNRMVELRDNWYWLGEIEWPGSRIWGLKCFAYVRRASPHFQELVASLETIIEIPQSQVDLVEIR